MEKYHYTFLLVGFVVLVMIIEAVREKINKVNNK
jgi:hypothetical protein